MDTSDTKHSLWRSASVIAFFTFLSRIAGFIRDIAIAKYVGAGFLSDIFFAAFKLPNLFRRTFAEGALNSAFIPIFSGVIDDRGKAQEFARLAFSFLIYTLLLITIIAELFMPWLMRFITPGFYSDKAKFSMAVDLARITFPYLMLISLAALLSAILNSYGKFAAAAATPIILNMTLVFALLFFRRTAENEAFALSWGVFIAGVLQLGWMVFATIKSGVLLYPVFPRLTPEIKSFFAKFFPGVLGSSVMQINVFVDTIIASLVPGAISYLSFADRLNQFPLAIIGTALGVALLPELSRRIKAGIPEKIAHAQNSALLLAVILTVPSAVFLVMFSLPIVSVLLERGKFSSEDTIAVAGILSIYGCGLLAFVLAKIFSAIFFANHDTKTPMMIGIASVGINLLLNLALMKYLSYFGIIISTVISSWCNVAMLVFMLKKRRLFTMPHRFFFDKIIKALLAALIAAVIALKLIVYFNGTSEFMRFISLFSVLFIGGVIYIALGFFLKFIPDIRKSRNLNNLLQNITGDRKIYGNDRKKIKEISTNSKRVQSGDLFIATKDDFIDEALKAGAVAAVRCDAELASKLISRFYPFQPDCVVAVTGTNGKSSVAEFTRQLWQLSDKKSAAIGTLGVSIPQYQKLHGYDFGLTTPDSLALHKITERLVKDAGVSHLILEASSHGLAQHRLDGMKIKIAAFTNLTRDHLDYHGTMEAYFSAKMRLFSELLASDGCAVLNRDIDEFFAIKEICERRGINVFTFGKSPDSDVRLIAVESFTSGQCITFTYSNELYTIDSKLIGEFQAMNLLCAISIAINSGADYKMASEIAPVKGRMQRVSGIAKDVYIDFAHSPDGLEQAILSLIPYKKLKGGRLITLFGTGGDRDHGKRAPMGEIATRYSDLVIITDDNPRTEDPVVIRQQIVDGCIGRNNYIELSPRDWAIKQAVMMMNDEDILLIAGKGHEQYQIIGQEKYPFNEEQIVVSSTHI